ncbi:MAG: HAD-IA family hydrolase, partial [Spirochaetota bacterium]
MELDLCSKRELAYELYNIAVSANKRIICVSDMYYESNFLNKLLQKNGYNKISKIYVSSEIGARKDTGDLYDYLLSQENVKPYEILHIGDNEQSDFLIPLSKGIIAFHLPNNKDLCITKKETFQKIWANPENYTPYERIIIGYTINKWTENIIGSTPQNLFGTKEEMGYFGIGPVLFSIAQILCTNSEIQTNYQVIHFASRDGYLPLKGYELLRTTVYNNCIEGEYLYAGRMLYNIANYNGDPNRYILDRIKKYPKDDSFSLRSLLLSTISPNILKKIKDEIPENYWVKKFNQKYISNFIQKNYDIFKNELNNRYKNICLYYSREVIFNNRGRAIVFDCGYSGSISESIMKFFNKRFIDKIYLWQTYDNVKKDKINKTKTYLLGQNLNLLRKKTLHLLFEEIFSKIEPPVYDFKVMDDSIIPLFDFDESAINSKTKDNLLIFQNWAIKYVEDVIEFFGRNYLSKLLLSSINFCLEPIESSLISPT